MKQGITSIGPDKRVRHAYLKVLVCAFSTLVVAISFGFGNLTSLTTPAVAEAAAASPTVTVGRSSHVLDGVNVQRGANQLILYTRTTSQISTPTNIYGAEVVVMRGIVTSVNDRLITHGGSTPIPIDGVVLSGHDLAREWLLANARIGVSVTLPPGTVTSSAPPAPTTAATTPTSSNPAPTAGFPAKAVGVYNMIWSNSPGPLSGEPGGVNVHLLAFGSSNSSGTITLMGYGPTGKVDLLAALATDRARGDKIILSLGGGGGYVVDLSATTARVNDIAAIASDIGGLDGVDIDIETGTINQAQIVAFAQGLRAKFGTGFAFTMAPNGSNVDQYRPIAKVLSDMGLLTYIGQQFYDAPVSLAAAKYRIQQFITVGIPQSQIAVGMMVGTTSSYWTLQQCHDYMTDIMTTWPGITKAYLWHAAGTGTPTWVSDMRSIFGL